MQPKDKAILRELGKQVADIAALPVQQETKTLWKALNALKPVRPMVLIDQLPWHEMDVNRELALQTEDGFCRNLENRLRRTLYLWKHMRVDMVIDPFIEIPKAINAEDFGLKIIEERAVEDQKNDVVGHAYFDQLKTAEDVQKIRNPVVSIDRKETAQLEAKAKEIFDGILPVRMQGYFPWFRAWDIITTWRGGENILYDLADRPELLHQIIARLTEAHLSMLDQLEKQGLLGWGQSLIHCTGAYTDELPAPGFDPQHPRAKDLWTAGMAQIFSSVSAAMHEEFEIAYAVRWYSHFGRGYYGCCEPLDNKIDIVRKIPNVRKISMSPWINLAKGAEQIGRDFVFSRKPSPALLAGDTWETDAVERDIRKTMKQCARYHCPLELILKDVSTVRYQPERLWKWAELVMRLVQSSPW